MTAPIVNPILRGFNPDPSIIRVGEDYYIAVSTFEWYPGVQIFHSRDLRNWRLVCRPLDRASQLDMRGNPCSGGVWAPCLTHADGKFWLIYSDVKRRSGGFKDTHNYLVTADSIEGPWSDPIYMNSSGFDPSLFHDDDGKKYFLNMIWDHTATERGMRFGGIVLQEYDAQQKKLVGPITNIFRGTDLRITEAPHLYRRDGYYYLITAEGGTEYGHACTFARSKDLLGPYEVDPIGQMLTARDAPEAFLQRAGHGDIVDTPAGDLYMVHLAARPLPGLRRTVTGRETAIQKIEWPAGDWPRLAHGSVIPAAEVDAPDLPEHPWPAVPEVTEFTPGPLPLAFQWPRSPDWQRLFSLDARPGHLRLYGRESVGSYFEQALVARRQDAWTFDAETEVDFTPAGYQQMAGLICYYNAYLWHYLHVTADENGNRQLVVTSCEGDYPAGKLIFPLDAPIPLGDGPVRLGVSVDKAELRFRYAPSGGDWQELPPILDHSILSDEVGRAIGGSHTGVFVGMAAQDTGGTVTPADFAWFRYTPK